MTASPGASTVDLAEAWISADPDPSTRDELAGVLEAGLRSGDLTQLEDRVEHRLAFGTAGLRGPMGAGPNRMNRLVVRQTAAGLARALTEHMPQPVTALIGHDARHNSDRFARDVYDVLTDLGVTCWLVDGPTPTPLVAWGMRQLGASAGVVVTASHNPALDNGIKIYWSDGAQIIPPTDTWIADAIDTAAGHGNPTAPELDAIAPPPTLESDYVSFVSGLIGARSASGDTRGPIRIAATSMHGVGASLLGRCLHSAGFDDLHMVPEQQQPDPDFPTVAFPNPEEPGATDLLLALARRVDADVAFANDPDADRLAVGVPGPDGWRMLSGDEVGALFAAGLIERPPAPEDARRPLFVTTVVSSQLLGRIAEASGAAFVETLTGFKWLCRPAIDDDSLRQVLAYEEALGYAVGGLRDKDGISAAVVMADLLQRWAINKVSPLDVLDDLARQHGAHVQSNFSIRLTGTGWSRRLAALMPAILADPPTDIAGIGVTRTDQPADDVLRMFLTNGDRVVIRPSGTEPKLKCYCEAVEAVDGDESVDAARARATERLATTCRTVESLIDSILDDATSG